MFADSSNYYVLKNNVEEQEISVECWSAPVSDEVDNRFTGGWLWLKGLEWERKEKGRWGEDEGFGNQFERA